MSDKPVLVTGVGGLVGSHVAYQLLEEGYHVRGTVRKLGEEKYKFLADFHPKAASHLELVETNLLSSDGWDKAVEGCDYVLHLASPFTFNYRDQETELVRPAVDGVVNVMNACFNAGVKRVVQTSSVCSVVYGHPSSRYKCDRKKVEAAKNERIKIMKGEDIDIPKKVDKKKSKKEDVHSHNKKKRETHEHIETDACEKEKEDVKEKEDENEKEDKKEKEDVKEKEKEDLQNRADDHGEILKGEETPSDQKETASPEETVSPATPSKRGETGGDEKENEGERKDDDDQMAPLNLKDTTTDATDITDGKAKMADLASLRTSMSTGTMLGDFKLFDESEFSVVDRIVGYELSKTLAEKKAWEMVEKHNEENPDRALELVALCPGFIFGPIFSYHQGFGESGHQIQRVLLKKYPFVPDLTSGHVDVRDVAKSHILAMLAPSENVAGQRFLISSDDGNLSFMDQARIIARYFRPYGFSPTVSHAPQWLINVGKYILPSVKAAANKTDNVCYVSNEKAHQRLGMTTWRSSEEALRAHCLTLIKCGVVEQRKVPQEVLDAYRPY